MEVKKKLQWGVRTPGLLIFLLDQSGSMYDKTQQVVKAIQDGVWPCLLDCENGDDPIKHRFFLVVISYSNHDAKVIEKSISNDDLYDRVNNARKSNTTFVNPQASGGTPMTEAFNLASQIVDEWINKCNVHKRNNELNGIPAPIVVNITDGEPDNKNTALTAAQKLMSKSTDGGNVILFNLHISSGSVDATKQFPKDLSDLDDNQASRFLYSISSELDEDMVKVAWSNGLETAEIGSKGLMINASGSNIGKFISFGSGSGSKVK